MRKAFILLAIVMQFIVLAYMGGEREYILRNGKSFICEPLRSIRVICSEVIMCA